MDMNEFLKDALSGRADVNAKGEHGRTAMMLAERNGHSEVVDILKKRVKKEGAK